MADYPYEPEAEKARPADGWGRASTFLLGLAIGAVIGLLATPAGRGALVPVQWLQALGQADTAEAPAKAPAAKPKAAIQPAARAALSANLPPAELRAPIAGQPMVVGVFGDSMADGLWAGLYRRLHPGGAYEVVRFSQASTGLTRYDYVDMQQKTQEVLDSRRLDVAILLTGTNDQQGIVDRGKVYGFDTPGWRAVYGERIENLVKLLRSRGVAVYWVGLPKMEHAGFAARATQVNGVFAERMAALNVPFIQTVPVTVDARGDYEDYLAEPGSGRKVLMRARDGIHMTMAGYIRIAGPVAERLQADVARVAASTAAVSTSAAASTAAVAATSQAVTPQAGAAR